MTWFWIATLGLLAASVGLVYLFAPIDESMGSNQKIIYLHLPVAINTIPVAGVLFLASIGYLWQQRPVWDDLANAAGRTTLLLCTVVLVTGVFLSKAVWGQWWLWSPRLMFGLILGGLYAVYLLLRITIRSPERRAGVCAVYGLAVFLDVPLVYLALNLVPDIHPAELVLTPSMRIILALMMIPITMLVAGLVIAAFQIIQRIRTQSGEPNSSSSIAGVNQ